MTTTHYKSNDQIVEIISTNDDARYPRHAAKMAILKMCPKPHSRCRQQWGGVSIMLTFEEIRALLEAVKACDPEFNYFLPEKFQNKPESRKQAWKQCNQQRVLSYVEKCQS
jgi:hypothetical protein